MIKACLYMFLNILSITNNDLSPHVTDFAETHSMFDQIQYMYIGGRLESFGSDKIINRFNGIIGGT